MHQTFSKRAFSQWTFSQRTFSKRAFIQWTFSQRTFSKRAFIQWTFSQRTFSKRAFSQWTFSKRAFLHGHLANGHLANGHFANICRGNILPTSQKRYIIITCITRSDIDIYFILSLLHTCVNITTEYNNLYYTIFCFPRQ